MTKKTSFIGRVLSILLAAIILSSTWGFPVYAQMSDLRLEKHSFRPGEEIRVHFVASPMFPADAWVGIIPSNISHGSEDVNDQHDITYEYLDKRTRGTLIFTAPEQEGTYDFRMHDTDDIGREICYVTFRVEDSREHINWPTNKPGLYRNESNLSLNKYVFRPGDEIKVHFQAPRGLAHNAWIGIIPSYVSHGSEQENDRHDISYEHINERRSGIMTFIAPSHPGSYDIRMHDTDDDNGTEINYISFEVRR